jgi:hypothetical protein
VGRMLALITGLTSINVCKLVRVNIRLLVSFQREPQPTS